MRMLAGVWTAQDAAMTRKVIHNACGRPGSLSTARQLSNPAGWISPSPSHAVKLSTRTPISGITPKATKNSRAGRASQLREPPPRPAFAEGRVAVATALTCR